MARNQEKAQSMLNRFLAVKSSGLGGKKKPHARRPKPEEVLTADEAERHRHDLVRLIARKITAIQNGSLGEHVIRDTNDLINRLLNEKRRWEAQIRKLGGRDYSKSGGAVADLDGSAVQLEGSEYMYFGAARELPGVREALEKQRKKQVRKSRKQQVLQQVEKQLDAEYFGFVDEGDRELIALEQQAEAAFLEGNGGDESVQSEEQSAGKDPLLELLEKGEDLGEFLPTNQQVDKAILQFRKKKLAQQLELY